MRSVTALFIGMLAVTSAYAAEVTTAASSEEACATQAVPTAVIRTTEAKGRMPVRGMNHFAAIYSRNLASDDSTTDAGDRSAAIAHLDGSRG